MPKEPLHPLKMSPKLVTFEYRDFTVLGIRHHTKEQIGQIDWRLFFFFSCAASQKINVFREWKQVTSSVLFFGSSISFFSWQGLKEISSSPAVCLLHLPHTPLLERHASLAVFGGEGSSTKTKILFLTSLVSYCTYKLQWRI